MHLIYDVSHNIAKVEQHMVDGKQKRLLVHRKVSRFFSFFSFFFFLFSFSNTGKWLNRFIWI